MNRRRITFQLAPLLDMLLIVFFTQYLEMQTMVERERLAAADARASADTGSDALERRVAHLDAENRKLVGEIAAAEKAQTEIEGLRTRQQELEAALRDVSRQRDAAGAAAAEMFRLPEAVVARFLSPARDAPGLSPEDAATLKKTLKALAENRAEETTRHLLTWAELRKRSDIWDVYLEPNGTTRFDTGERKTEFRAVTADAFARDLFERYKTSPQPKSMVIILVSWGNTPARYREAAIEGVRRAADEMRQDSAGRSRFEYAVLGFRPREP